MANVIVDIAIVTLCRPITSLYASATKGEVGEVYGDGGHAGNSLRMVAAMPRPISAPAVPPNLIPSASAIVAQHLAIAALTPYTSG